MIIKVMPQKSGIDLVLLKRNRWLEGPSRVVRGTRGLALETVVSVAVKEMRQHMLLAFPGDFLESS